jgi:hypothetical protein
MIFNQQNVQRHLLVSSTCRVMSGALDDGNIHHPQKHLNQVITRVGLDK